ncbi:MAG TPA: HNH endonuclease [Caldilineae bacterium]|nr:HNH endonuclease [Caldilineae bacterium]
MNRSRISAKLRQQVAEDAGHHCGYCLLDEVLSGVSLAVDHIIPIALNGGTTRDNLWLACRSCNEFKGSKIQAEDPVTGQLAPLFDPRRQDWSTHFRWSKDKTEIEGLTPTGRATVDALRLNRPALVHSRRRWVSVGWHPPKIGGGE